MKEQKIESITEAFSMQPTTLRVTPKDSWERMLHKEDAIKEIREVWNGDQIRVYRGFNYDDKKMFEYLANSVNVHYQNS